MPEPALPRLYAAAFTLLVVHEIDSASWREWELFGLPVGLPLFLALHVPLVAAGRWGHGEVRSGSRTGAWAALAVAAAALAAPLIHGVFLAAGRPQFRTGASLAVLAGCLVGGIALAAVAVRALRPWPSPAVRPPSRSRSAAGPRLGAQGRGHPPARRQARPSPRERLIPPPGPVERAPAPRFPDASGRRGWATRRWRRDRRPPSDAGTHHRSPKVHTTLARGIRATPGSTV
jgi:hypothetical protein